MKNILRYFTKVTVIFGLVATTVNALKIDNDLGGKNEVILMAKHFTDSNISAEKYMDKMKGGWIGQIVGVCWGQPVEFHYCGSIMPNEDMPKWTPDMVNQAFGQDDLYVEMTFLHSMEKHGINVSMRQAGIDFANSRYSLAHANLYGRGNLRKGIAPPDSGHPEFTAHSDDIDYQIESDFSGLIAPGMPNVAIKLGDKFGHLMNYGDGVYGGMFVGGMYSAAFFENDIEKIIKAGLACIPEKSQYHEAISDVIKWYHKNPNDWKKSWKLIQKKYLHNPNYRRSSCNRESWKKNGELFDIDAKINGAYIVMGLLYGNRNIEKTALIAAQCGQDSDCNPSSAVGVLGTIYGFKALPEKYKQIDEKTKFSFTDYNFPQLINVCNKLAKKFIVANGGYIETNKKGVVIYNISVKKPKPITLEQSWMPKPITGNRFSKTELAKIIQGNKINLGPFGKNWTVTACGFDCSPGYYKEKLGHKNVLVTHPFDQTTGCVLKRTVTIPKNKKTTLHLVVGHYPDPKADWDLIVKVNTNQKFRKTISSKTTSNDFCSINIDLTDHAGQTVDLELINEPTGWCFEVAYWDVIEIISE